LKGERERKEKRDRRQNLTHWGAGKREGRKGSKGLALPISIGKGHFAPPSATSKRKKEGEKRRGLISLEKKKKEGEKRKGAIADFESGGWGYGPMTMIESRLGGGKKREGGGKGTSPMASIVCGKKGGRRRGTALATASRSCPPDSSPPG